MYLAAKCIKPPSGSALPRKRHNTTTNKRHLGPMCKNLDTRIPTNTRMFHTKCGETLEFLRMLIFKYVYHPQTLTSMNATQKCIWQSVIKESNDKYVFAIMCICLFFTYNCDINNQVSGWCRLPLTNQTANQFHERALLEKVLSILTVCDKTW